MIKRIFLQTFQLMEEALWQRRSIMQLTLSFPHTLQEYIERNTNNETNSNSIRIRGNNLQLSKPSRNLCTLK